MTQDPTWGMLARLSLDNCGEHGFADILCDALKLVSRNALKDMREASAITNARTETAEAKPIEGLRGCLAQRLSSRRDERAAG